MSKYMEPRESVVFACYFDFLILLFSVRIFCNSVVRHESFFKGCIIELISERCIGSLFDRVFEVKQTYILFSEIQPPKGHLN